MCIVYYLTIPSYCEETGLGFYLGPFLFCCERCRDDFYYDQFPLDALTENKLTGFKTLGGDWNSYELCDRCNTAILSQGSIL